MEKIIDALISGLKAKKLTADIYAERAEKTEIQSNDLEITAVKEGIHGGIGLRVFKDGKMGFGYHTGLKPEDAAGFIEKIAAACLAEGYEGYLPAPAASYDAVETTDPEHRNIPVEAKKRSCIETETAAMQADKRVNYSRDTTYYDSVYDFYYFSSEGARGKFTRTYYSIFTSAIASAEKGGPQEFAESARTAGRFSGLDFKGCGAEAGDAAAGLTGGSGVKSGAYDILLPAAVAADFVSFLSSLFLSVNARKGKTLLKDTKEGGKIASSLVTIRDNPLLPFGTNSYPFDAEGEAGKNRLLVDRGAFCGFLFDRHNSMLMKGGAPGNCLRPSFKDLPMPAPSNMYIEPGNVKQAEAVKNGRYLKINSMMGMHTADPVSGNFSVGINGWLLDNGRIVQPVKEVLLTGNIIDVLEKVSCVCDDLSFRNNFGSPSLIIENLQIAGK